MPEHGRTPAQIRAEIAAERASLDQAVSGLLSDAKRTARHYLAKVSRLPIRFLVYADWRDLFLGQEAQRAGAFYEYRERADSARCRFIC